MFGPTGHPTAENLLGVIGVLQAETAVHLEARAIIQAASVQGHHFWNATRGPNKMGASGYNAAGLILLVL